MKSIKDSRVSPNQASKKHVKTNNPVRKRKVKHLCELDRFDADVKAGLDRPINREKRRYKAGKRCCSASWQDAVWFGELRDKIEQDEDGTPHIVSYRQKIEHPPGGDHTGMILCTDGRYYPPQYVVTTKDGRKVCYDDAQATWADSRGNK